MSCNITLPKLEDNGRFILCDNEGISEIPYKTRGLYFIYGRNYEILYIGKSIDIATRLRSHISGKSNTSEFAREFKFFKYTEIINLALQDIYETYYIDMYKPPANKAKVFYTNRKSQSNIDANIKFKTKIERKECGRCSKKLSVNRFYNSSNKYDSHGKMSVCKECFQDIYIDSVIINQDRIKAVRDICKMFNIYFAEEVATKCEEDNKLSNAKIITSYITIINSLPQYKDLQFK